MPHPTPNPGLHSIHNACKLHGTSTCPTPGLRSIHSACKLHGTSTCRTPPQPSACKLYTWNVNITNRKVDGDQLPQKGVSSSLFKRDAKYVRRAHAEWWHKTKSTWPSTPSAEDTLDFNLKTEYHVRFHLSSETQKEYNLQQL